MSNTETIKINRQDLINIEESTLDLERQSYTSLQEILSMYISNRNEIFYCLLTSANRHHRNVVNSRKSNEKIFGF